MKRLGTDVRVGGEVQVIGIGGMEKMVDGWGRSDHGNFQITAGG